MKSHRIAAVISRQLYEVKRSPSQFTNIIYWPIVNIAVWGFFTLYLAHGDNLKPSLLNCLLSGAILWGFFNGFQRDMALGFLEDLWSRNLVNLFASPLTISEYTSALVIVTLLKTFISIGVMALIALGFYHYNIISDLPLLIPFLLVLSLAAGALGIVVTGLIFRFTTKVQALAWSFAGLLMPLSCVFYPMSVLPTGLQKAAWLLPTAHAFEGMRIVIVNGSLSLEHLLWGLSLDAAYLLLASILFGRMFRAARKRGLLVKTT